MKYLPGFPGRQERHHHPQSADALLRAAARRGPEAGLERLLRPASRWPTRTMPPRRRARASFTATSISSCWAKSSDKIERPDARRNTSGDRILAAGDEGHDVPAAGLAAPAHRAHRELAEGPASAARRGSRPDHSLHGRRGGPCRPVLDGRGPGEFLRDDARSAASAAACASSARSRVAKFTSPADPADQPILRGLGWDIDSPFSGNRGDLFPIGSFGHTGFTGTSIWIDPATNSYVILLANSVHPLRRPADHRRCAGKWPPSRPPGWGWMRPEAVLTGYNETLAGPGSRRVVDRNGAHS